MVNGSVQRFLNSATYHDARLLAFDFDGVLADTELFQMLAFKSTAEQLSPKNIELDVLELTREMISRPESVILSILKERHEIPHSLEELLDIRARAYTDLALEELTPNPSAVAILQHAQHDGKQCLVLSNGRSNVLQPLAKAWGIFDYFDEWQTVDLRHIADKVEWLKDRAASTSLSHKQIALLEDSGSTILRADQEGFGTAYFKHDLNTLVVTSSNLVLPCTQGSRRPDSVRALRAAGVKPNGPR